MSHDERPCSHDMSLSFGSTAAGTTITILKHDRHYMADPATAHERAGNVFLGKNLVY